MSEERRTIAITINLPADTYYKIEDLAQGNCISTRDCISKMVIERLAKHESTEVNSG